MRLTECSLLAAMAYDQYAAVCNPRLYMALISHTLCLKLVAVPALACSDIFSREVVTFILDAVVGVMSVLVVLFSYGYTVAAVLRISSAKGRTKAFSTSASHLTAVAIFYGSGLFMYRRPNSSYSLNQDKVVSVFYAVVVPLVNPII
ncbi:olfactory receptor 5A2 [Sigmodon hispidus]